MTQEDTNGWAAYYQSLTGRSPRPLLLEALALWAAEATPAVHRSAVDLGCGDGTETLALLKQGWRVLAIDQEQEAIRLVQAKAAPAHQAQLVTLVASSASLVLPSVDFVYAGLSLPFCTPEHFPQLWATIVGSIGAKGRFAGHFFGTRDSWVTERDMTFHTLGQVQQLFTSFTIEACREIERDGQAFSGPKHWHVFEVIARKAAD